MTDDKRIMGNHPLQVHFDHFKKLKTKEEKLDYLELIRPLVGGHLVNVDALLDHWVKSK